MPAKSQADKYLEALARLKARGEPINNDAVAKEAGSGKGSIKRSRPGHAALIAAIEQAAMEQKQAKATSDQTPQLRQQIATLQHRLDNALEREVCLLNELYDLREENRQLKLGRLAVVK
jgi:ubiquinone biosynthesis protein UbiJ